MPIGIQRLNAKKSQPNPNIVFIKPLPGPNEKTAQEFLEKIAAQCLPVTRKHHISIMTLEEYEPNREFVGRNFNAGEVIQLVLRSPSTGRWLPFEYVQMVMMHELAHCKQMNHSRAFWAVRNAYAAQMYELWKEGYAGDGIWGRGASLITGERERNQVHTDEVLPEHLCGGTYRSRRRKRRVKPTLTYRERKEKRILKKFGQHGVALGADEEIKVKLEKGKRVQAKPRVASSARGRELRAAAALARFEKREVEESVVLQDEDETESESEDEYEDETADGDGEDAVDVDGSTLRDSKGRGMLAEMFEQARKKDSGATSPQTSRVETESGKRRAHSTAKREALTDGPRLDGIPVAPSGRETIATRTKTEPGGSSQRPPPRSTSTNNMHHVCKRPRPNSHHKYLALLPYNMCKQPIRQLWRLRRLRSLRAEADLTCLSRAIQASEWRVGGTPDEARTNVFTDEKSGNTSILRDSEH
ncbi:hypothetical protein ED733_005526 [Metarhizium rileyi]|uniref:WLM domain-containing protein n=1 Tax=Metarhizium rileyi (strain RCEF 4871) TaxID=1649241 RepID=A0A5C6GKR4_METRR|nr:hypothetical protein ED733_005526 [Metarhizium rileyi]